MNSFAALLERLRAISKVQKGHDEEEPLLRLKRPGGQNGRHAKRRFDLGMSAVAPLGAGPAKTTFDDYDERLRSGGRSVRFISGLRKPAKSEHQSKLSPGPTRARGLAAGGQKAVVKLVSFASGSSRVGALAAYVTKEREGGVPAEDEDGMTLDGPALAAKLTRWKETYSGRRASKDVATIRFEVRGDPALDKAAVEAALRQIFVGHRFATRSVPKGEGAFETTAVVAAEGQTAKRADGHARRQARYKFDKKFENFVAEKLADELGAKVEARVTGTSHGRDGVAHRLSQLIATGGLVDEIGEITTIGDARGRADDWKKTLGSRKARDAIHLVLSAKPGTDPRAFRQTAREVLAAEFGGHEYFFGMHSDRGHLHAHAVILVKGADGRRLRPDITAFAAWRSRYAEVAQRHGINMVATRRSDTASPPAFDQAEAAMTARGVAPEYIRRKVEAKRAHAIHVPVREEGRRRVNEAYQHWKQIESHLTTSSARETVNENLTRLSASINLSHSTSGRAISKLPMVQRGATMARVTGDYLSSEFNRANQVLNRALPLLEGSDKIEATQLANAYLASLAKQLEAVQAMEAATQSIELARAPCVQEEREEDVEQEVRLLHRGEQREAPRKFGGDPRDGVRNVMGAEAGEAATDHLERLGALQRAEADVLSSKGEAVWTNAISPVTATSDRPESSEAASEDPELLIDRIELEGLSHTRVHRQ